MTPPSPPSPSVVTLAQAQQAAVGAVEATAQRQRFLGYYVRLSEQPVKDALAQLWKSTGAQ